MIKSSTSLHKAISALMLTLILGACGGDSADSLVASGRDYLAKNDSKAAVIQLKNALQKNPEQGEARYLLGLALFDSGDVGGAELELRKALKLNYSQDVVTPLLARVLLASGQAKVLIDEFSSARLNNAPANASLLTALSAAQAALGKMDNAKQLLKDALSADPNNLTARIAEIRTLAQNHELMEARQKIDALLAMAPNNPEVLMLKGGMLVLDKDQTGAEAQYQKAIEAKPSFIQAHIALIMTALQVQELDKAAQRLEALKKVAPNNPQTILLDAQLRYQRKEFAAARELSQQLLRMAPNNPTALQLAGAVEFQLNSFLQAETYLTRAIQLAPQLPLARRMLVANYLRTGQYPKAIDTLQPVMAQADQDSALASLVAEAYLRAGNAPKASEYFAKASKLEPENAAKKTSLALAHMAQGQAESAIQELEQIAVSDKGVTADLALIATLLRSNQVDKALKAIASLERKQPDDPATHNLRAQALLAKKDVSGARNSLEKAVALRATYFPAVSALATLDLIDKKADDARKRFESVIAVEPKNMEALLALASIKAANGGTVDEVVGLINKAVTANPAELAPRVALIQYYLQKKDNKKALSAANDAATAIPDKPEIMEALGKTQQLSGDLNAAIVTYGKLATMQPASPVPPMHLAELHLANKNETEATKALKKALELKPDLLEAQRALMQMAVASKNTSYALDIARTIQKQRPKEAVGYLFESDVHATTKSWPDAIRVLEIGLKQAPAPQLATKLHSMYLATNNLSEAEKLSANWQKEHPKDVSFRMYLGDLAVAQKRYADAMSQYQSALLLQPDNALILNNLAWVAGQSKSPKAIDYAEKANALAPKQPAFMDTLAMLLAENGNTAKAIDLLREAMSLAPQAAAIQLNLARTLIKAGHKDEARKELEALAKLGDSFSGNLEVARLKQELQ